MKRTKLPKLKQKSRPRSHRVHRHLIGLFAIAAVGLLILNTAVILAPVNNVQATTSENVTGWAWSSSGGWLSMNNTNVGSGGGSYGVNIDSSTSDVTGFAWSNNIGWVCFGQTCNAHPNCTGTPPAGSLTASMDGSNELRGWAKICNLGDDGWISLNCADASAGGVCGTSNYQVSVNLSTGAFSGWAWHSFGGAAGWGWIDFSGVSLDTTGVEDFDNNPSFCANTLDDDLDADIDCADSGCTFREPTCPSSEDRCFVNGGTNCCINSIDDDYDGPVDCDDSDCSSVPQCIPENIVAGQCTDGIDNDLDGAFDCADSDCAGEPGCEICDNDIDDDGDTDIDCDDSDCATNPICTPAWLQSKYGNVYATLGIEGNPPPLGSNATYCLTTAGTSIVGFSSETGCEETSEASIDLPIGPGGYVSTLGRLDVNGVLNGRYGEVETITSQSQMDNPLNGKVYVYECGAGDFTLSSRTFLNASGTDTRGSGLLVIKGCNLNVTGDLAYQGTGVTQYLRNLASFGILVLAQYSGSTYVSGGNISIDPSVTQIVGTMYAERSIATGSTGDRDTDQQLEVYGALVSREILLERRWSRPDEAAEVIEFDGRGVVNPPPGYQDIAKSLPTVSDRF